jgi:hypothetical protein
MEYRITELWVMVGWRRGAEFCAHWYIGRHGIGAEVGTIVPNESVLLVDYYAPTNTVDVLVSGLHRCKHGRE